jgi:hypothetical protein
MGLEVLGGDATTSVTIRGSRTLVPITSELYAANADLAWPILLAALSSPGDTTVVAEEMLDHVRHVFKLFGANLSSTKRGDAWASTMKGEVELTGASLLVSENGQSISIETNAAS